MSAALHDVIVLGGGPAGCTAALYCARSGLDVLILERLCAGGQMALTDRIDNYPGFETGVDGFTLGEKMQKTAWRFGAAMKLAEVRSAALTGPVKTFGTSEGTFQSRAAILAAGAVPKPLGVPEESAFLGRGVHYCAACDGMAYRGRVVAVVGGGNSAVADALLLSRLCRRVILVHRRDALRAEQVLQAPLFRRENVEFRWDSAVTGLLHGEHLDGLCLRSLKTGAESMLACDGVFVSIGRRPATDLFRAELTLDDSGYVLAGETTRTALPGVFAAGDLRTKPLRQIVTAVSDGATAAHFAAAYLSETAVS